MGNSLRPPAVAGAFYPEDGAALGKAIEAAFLDARGPRELPPRHRAPDRHIRAAIVPHAGYVYSGPIAALAYHAIASERPPQSVLVLGVNHRGVGPSAALSARGWATPIGPVPSDPHLVAALQHAPVRIDESAHAPEHSIEVQLPFLLYTLPAPRFAALSVSYASFDELTAVARIVRQAVQGRDVLLVASTDFSHYIPAERARRLDAMALAAIEKGDALGLYETVARNDISMCGVAPTTVLLSALETEPLRVKRLAWGHSGEAERMRDVVGYASLLLESEKPIPRDGGV